MKKYYFLILVYFFCMLLKAQENQDIKDKEWLIGLNGSRLLYNFILSNNLAGYSIDPIVKYKYNRFVFELDGGYTHANMKRNIPNIDKYKNIGYYGRVGINFMLYKMFSIGGGFIYSQSKEYFGIRIKGNIFDDYTANYSRGNLTTQAVDIKIQTFIPISKKIALTFSVNPTYIISFQNAGGLPPEYQEIPYYYMVGVGQTLFSIYKEDRPNNLTMSCQLQCLWRLSNR